MNLISFYAVKHAECDMKGQDLYLDPLLLAW